MKTDLSLPRPLTEAAEQLAQKLGVPLSELYAAALSAYITTHHQNNVTELLDQVYSTETSTLEPMLMQLQVASLGNETW